MKLQQFRFIWEVAHHKLNISETAKSLFTSQPGISKHILQLENELGVEIFSRNGRHMVGITPAGEKILQMSGEILQHVENIKQVAQEYSDPHCGTLQVAVTHMYARYVLPQIIRRFNDTFPKVSVQLHQDVPNHISELIRENHVDMILTSKEHASHHELSLLPCFHWKQAVLVPDDHPLNQPGQLTLAAIAKYPLIVYANDSAGYAAVENAFTARKMCPRIACTAADSDVIKSCVRMGLGVGIISAMACREDKDSDLVAIDASHLIEPCTAYLGLWKYAYLREFNYYFIEQLGQHLNRDLVQQARALDSSEKRRRLFRDMELPVL